MDLETHFHVTAVPVRGQGSVGKGRGRPARSSLHAIRVTYGKAGQGAGAATRWRHGARHPPRAGQQAPFPRMLHCSSVDHTATVLAPVLPVRCWLYTDDCTLMAVH